MKTLIQLFEENAPEGEILAAIAAGVDVNARGKNERTPLFIAVRRGDEAMTRLLIESGANVNAKDDRGESLLYWATLRGDSNIIRLLIEAGANVNARNDLSVSISKVLAFCGRSSSLGMGAFHIESVFLVLAN